MDTDRPENARLTRCLSTAIAETGRPLAGSPDSAHRANIGVIPYINSFSAIELIGIILVMVALYDLSRYYNDGSIFNNALYGIVTGVTGIVISLAVVFVAVLTSLTNFLYEIFPDWNSDFTALSGLTPDPSILI